MPDTITPPEPLSPEDDAQEATEAREVLERRGITTEGGGKGGRFGKPRIASREPVKIEGVEPGIQLQPDMPEGEDRPEPPRNIKTRRQQAQEPEVEEEDDEDDELTPEEILPDAAAERIVRQLLGDDAELDSMPPAQRGAIKRLESRLRESEVQRDQYRRYADELLTIVRDGPGSGGKAKGTKPAEPELEIDMFEDPDGWYKQRVRPLEQQLAERDRRLEALEAQIRQDRLVSGERDYERGNPGYKERLNKFRKANYEAFIEQTGGDEKKAAGLLQRMDAGVIQIAAELGKAPWEVYDQRAREFEEWEQFQAWKSGKAPQQSAPRPARRSRKSSIEAAAEAARSGVTGSPSREGGEAEGRLGIDELVARGVRPGDARRVLVTEGREGFRRLLREVEGQ